MDRKDLARKRKNKNMANIQLFWPNELSLINKGFVILYGQNLTRFFENQPNEIWVIMKSSQKALLEAPESH